MLKKSLLILSALSLNLAINGCATSPPDIPVCVEIHQAKGYCVNTISAKEFVVDDEHKLDGKTWWDASPSMLMLPATSWAKLKTYIITQCKATGACDKEITSWDRTINTIDKTLEEK